jgi:hypothetical protein
MLSSLQDMELLWKLMMKLGTPQEARSRQDHGPLHARKKLVSTPSPLRGSP